MKKILLCFLIGFGCSPLFAQTHIEKKEYQKIDRDILVNEIGFSEKLITDALTDTLEKLGYKGKSQKGYTVYQGVKLSSLGKESYDLYFSVERKSRKEKETSVVNMIVSKGFDNFATEAADRSLMENAKSFLNDLRNTVSAYELEQQINEQEQVIKKNEKKSAGLISDAESLEQKRKKMEQQIEDNKKDQAALVNEQQKQQQILENLKSRRKN
ncbi:MAG: hypothetical protein JWQ27_2760 [Ferruginibacter sp.]|nr:hypothetical protein [Ferruginibacter sp.]